jgi:hypothetical protein
MSEAPQTPTAEVEVLFSEAGASWVWLSAGPVAGIAMMIIQINSGYGPKPLVPGIFLVLVTSFLAVQVKAARIHTSVELTAQYLREGRETILIPEILKVYPEAEGRDLPNWQAARALGELTGVPRGRTGIGIKLSKDRSAQAWARKHRDLRAALESLVKESTT